LPAEKCPVRLLVNTGNKTGPNSLDFDSTANRLPAGLLTIAWIEQAGAGKTVPVSQAFFTRYAE
jgi:hypothetical protein